MNVAEFVADARKAVVTLGTLETAAVTLGVLDSAQAGVITAVLGAVTTVLVYFTPRGSSKGVDMGGGTPAVDMPPSPGGAVA